MKSLIYKLCLLVSAIFISENSAQNWSLDEEIDNYGDVNHAWSVPIQNALKVISRRYSNGCRKYQKPDSGDVLQTLLEMVNSNEKFICNSLENFHIVQISLKQHFVDNCVKYIIDNDIMAALDIYEQLGTKYLNDIVQKSFKPSSVNNQAEYIFKFLYDLNLNDTLLGYKYLFSELKKQNDLKSVVGLALSYHANEYFRNEEHSSISTAVFQYIMDNTPPFVKNFPFNMNFQIITIYKQILFGSDADVSNRQTALSWNVEEKDKLNESDVWKLEPIGNGLNFKIKNVKSSKYLYADTHFFNHDNQRRYVLLGSGTTSLKSDEWQFGPLSDGSFSIKNIHWNEYMYVPNNNYYQHGSHGRFTFTWTPGILAEDGHFNIHETL